MSDEAILRECPLCGGEAECNQWRADAAFSVCKECGCGTRYYATEAEAIAAWNERAYLNPDGLPNGLTISDDGTLLDWRGENYVKQSTLGGVCENISDPPDGFLCSSCGWGDFAEPSHLLTSAKYTGRIHGGPNYCPNCGKAVER